MKYLSREFFVFFIACIASCSKDANIESGVEGGNNNLNNQDYAVVRTFFATDRKQIESADPKKLFGVERGKVSYGVAEVSIPRDHRMGELESPSIFRLEFREDPAKHIVLSDVQLWTRSEFFKLLSDRVKKSELKRAFIFIHGYNVTFTDAARRTAQMSYDLAFDGVPVFYSWPSQASVYTYTVDEQNIEWAQANIKAFLHDFFNRSEADQIFLIAHSMGSRGLTKAIASLLQENPKIKSKLQEVILATPDIDAEVFKQDIAPLIASSGRPITLYASSEGKALKASKKVHGNARAGDAGEGLVVLQGIETIDATKVSTSFIGHSYYADNRSVLSDIFYIVRTGRRANDRFGLRLVNSGFGEYWEFNR